MKLSIFVPVYNEARLIAGVLDRIVSGQAGYFDEVGIEPEVIVVDDGSHDETYSVIERYAAMQDDTSIHLLRHTRNRGKGAAIRTALAAATGEFCIIQDADFEYDPSEYDKLLRPLLADEADVVFGSRFAATGERHVLRFWHATANRVLTKLCGIAANLDLTDALTGCKAFRTAMAQSMPFRSERFGIEAELTIKFARRRARFCEVPISYCPRSMSKEKRFERKTRLEFCGQSAGRGRAMTYTRTKLLQCLARWSMRRASMTGWPAR